MAETMSHVERVLWRIAELGARCSQQAAAGERGPLWAELEQTIAGLEAEIEAARQAVDIAPEQVRTLEGRLKVARQERDREKARNQEHVADAEAARRERDRAIQKARKAMAITTEAKSAALEARSTAAECVARASAAENTAKRALAARDEAIASRDEAVNALAEALTSRDRAVNALAEAVATGERAVDARDEALASRDTTLRALEALHARITELEAALAASRTERDDAVDTLAARADGAVVVLPGMAIPEAPVGPITTGSRVSWQPDCGRSGPDPTPRTSTRPLRSSSPPTCRHRRRRRGRRDPPRRLEGRGGGWCARLPQRGRHHRPAPPRGPRPAPAVRRHRGAAGRSAIRHRGRPQPGPDTMAQAERFTDAGFKVEWTSNAPLGV